MFRTAEIQDDHVIYFIKWDYINSVHYILIRLINILLNTNTKCDTIEAGGVKVKLTKHITSN